VEYDVGESLSCGSGNCVGTKTCGYDGSWSTCDTNGKGCTRTCYSDWCNYDSTKYYDYPASVSGTCTSGYCDKFCSVTTTTCEYGCDDSRGCKDCDYSLDPDGCTSSQYCTATNNCASCSSFATAQYANCDRTGNCEVNLKTDEDNCGWCGYLCNSDKKCVDGKCEANSCTSDTDPDTNCWNVACDGTYRVSTTDCTCTSSYYACTGSLRPTASISASPNPVGIGETITITVTGSDDVDITRVDVFIEGKWYEQYCTGSSDKICSKSWTWSASSEGDYTFWGGATDSNAKGAALASTSITVTGCTGNVFIDLEPNPADPQQSVTPSASGLTGCMGKTIYFKKGSCNENEVSRCTIGPSGTGCVGQTDFKAEGGTEQYINYYACIDKDGDGSYDQ
jgi:hypothetical protein